ncbi:hypothetical protein GCM10010478_57050 [Streptomyces erythrogriseus]|uniref:Uncharacterized protein n=1 Tax=Streptomyces erythrogriseus TaxID=284027 RepID=A0ABN3XCC9_9ACTN
MCARCVFDFGGADVEAAADDDVLEPPEDIVPSVLVQLAEVNGPHPAVRCAATGFRLGQC